MEVHGTFQLPTVSLNQDLSATYGDGKLFPETEKALKQFTQELSKYGIQVDPMKIGSLVTDMKKEFGMK